MGNDRLTKIVADAVPGLRGVGEVFFATDVVPDISVAGTLFTYNIQITAIVPALIEITTDGRVTWHAINNGVALAANATFTAQELIDLGGAFNIRTVTPSGVTLDRGIVRLV